MFGMRSDVELDLNSVLEGPLVAGEIVDVEADRGLAHVLEEHVGELEEEGGVELAADSHLGGQLVVGVVVLHAQQGLTEERSPGIEDTLG